MLTGGRRRDRDHRIADRSFGAQRCFDLAEFDAETSDLDLEICTLEVFEAARGIPPNQIAGSIETLSRSIRVGDETARVLPRIPDVPARQLNSSEIELTCDTDRNRVKPLVEYMQARVPGGGSDRHYGNVCIARSVRCDADRCFRGSVQVVDLRRTLLSHVLGCLYRESLADAQNPGERIRQSALGHTEQRQHRGDGMQCRDVLTLDQQREVLAVLLCP